MEKESLQGHVKIPELISLTDLTSASKAAVSLRLECNSMPHWGSDGKESICNAQDLGSIPGLGRFPGEGNGYPLQYSCLENSMDWAAVYGVAQSRT